MKRLYMPLLALAFASGLSAQIGYYGMTATWYPYYGQPISFVRVNNGFSQGFTNQFVAPGDANGGNADWIQSEANCYSFPSPNYYLWFAVSLANQCPEGSYISEDASNGYYPDNPPPNQTSQRRMIHDGVSIDAADSFTQIEILEEFWSCEDFYNGPSLNYEDYLNPCLG